MVAHRDEEIKEPNHPTHISTSTINTQTSQEQRDKNSQPPTPLHLHLHRPTPLKRRPAAYNQRQIVRPQLRIAVRRIGIREPRTSQDGRALDPRLQALLSQRKPLELIEPVLLRRAIQQRIFQQHHSRARMQHRALHRPSGPSVIALGALELPRIAALVVQQAWVVVAFVEVFEHGGEDLRELVGQVDAFGDGFEKLAAADGGEEGGGGEDGFVGGEEALFGADAEGDYRGG